MRMTHENGLRLPKKVQSFISESLEASVSSLSFTSDVKRDSVTDIYYLLTDSH